MGFQRKRWSKNLGLVIGTIMVQGGLMLVLQGGMPWIRWRKSITLSQAIIMY